MSTRMKEYHPNSLLLTQERPSRYKPGGLHPVEVGDTFNDGRYIVIHKLGFGGFSSVWAAHDKKYVIDSANAFISTTNGSEPQSVGGSQNHDSSNFASIT